MLSISDVLAIIIFCAFMIVIEWKTVTYFVKHGKLPEKKIETLIDGQVRAGRAFLLPLSFFLLLIVFVYIITNFPRLWSELLSSF